VVKTSSLEEENQAMLEIARCLLVIKEIAQHVDPLTAEINVSFYFKLFSAFFSDFIF